MLNKKNLFILFLLLIIPFTFANAQGLVPCGHGSDPANACTLCDLIVGIQNIVNWGLDILITVAAVGIFIAGIMYIISSGNEEMITKSKNFLKATLIGFTVVLMAWFFVNLTMRILAKNNVLNIDSGKTWNKFKCN